MKKQYLEAGRIINTHGVAGEVKFEYWCDDISSLDKIKVLYLDSEGTKPLNISQNRKHQGFILFTFDEITSVEDARRYKTKVLYVKRDDLDVPEDRLFIADLIGLEVIDAKSGEHYGKVVDIYNRGAGNIYEIKRTDRTLLFPAVKEFIERTDLNEGIFINPPKGLFD